MEPFSVRTTLTLADWQAYQKNALLRVQQDKHAWGSALTIVVSMIIGFCIVWLFDALHHKLDLLSAFLGLSLAIALIVLNRRRVMKAAKPEEGGAFLRPCMYHFGPDGIDVTQDGLRLQSQWSRVRAIAAATEHIFIWVDRSAAHVVPLRDLPAGMTGAEAVARMQAWAATATSQTDLPPTSSVPVSADSPSFAQPGIPAESSGPRWLPTAFRLLTLRRTDGTALSGSTASILLLSLLSLAIWVATDWLGNLPDSQFSPYDAPLLAWFILAALLTAATLTRLSYPTIALSRVCALLAIVIPILIAVDFVIERYVPERWIGSALLCPAIYAIAYCDRGLKALSGNRQPRAIAVGVLVAFAFLSLGSAAYVRPSLWVEPGAQNDASEEDWDAAEATLFDQSARIDASLANVVRPPGESPAAFFVGFAGYGEQRVFAEEIKLAARVFAQRYDTSSRTILLLNDRRDLDAQPLASVSGLRYALKGLASRMQLDRDILFLALSSHGSEEPMLSVSNGSIPLRNLSGDDLAEALDESGIKWRVIMISACHAGAFIDSLRDPHTIVITAAAPDRTSFGCSDARDLTYFGETFFRDSVPKAASLRDAFNAAKVLIEAREKQEGIEASNPQAFFGEEVERRLSTLEKAAAESRRGPE